MQSKREGRFSEPTSEIVFRGTSKEFDREEPLSETNIPCGRYKIRFPELVTCSHFTAPVAHQDLSQQKSVSKVPLTLMGSKQVLNCAWPQNSSRQSSSPAQQTQPEKARAVEGTKVHTSCCGKRSEQPDHEEQRRWRIMKNQHTKKMFDWSTAFCIYLLHFHWVTKITVEKVRIFCKRK